MDLQFSHGGLQGLDAHRCLFQIHCAFDQFIIKSVHVIIERLIFIFCILTVIFA